MRNERFRAAIEKMEAWLANPSWAPDTDELALWNSEFQEALSQAEKGLGWPALAGRAHTAGKLLEARILDLEDARDRIREELQTQERGHRALKGYGTNTR